MQLVQIFKFIIQLIKCKEMKNGMGFKDLLTKKWCNKLFQILIQILFFAYVDCHNLINILLIFSQKLRFRKVAYLSFEKVWAIEL